MIADQWNYGAFDKTFHDFSTNSACPISSYVPPNANRDTKVYMKSNGDVVVEGNDALYELNILPVDVKHHEAYDAPVLRWGGPKYFESMSVTARAFLTPNQSIRRIIQKVCEDLTSQNSSYAFVHVRRGVKHAEAQFMPISKYVEKLNTENSRRNNSVGTVFLMCDGEQTCQEFSLVLSGSYRLITYKTLMEDGMYGSLRQRWKNMYKLRLTSCLKKTVMSKL